MQNSMNQFNFQKMSKSALCSCNKFYEVLIVEIKQRKWISNTEFKKPRSRNVWQTHLVHPMEQWLTFMIRTPFDFTKRSKTIFTIYHLMISYGENIHLRSSRKLCRERCIKLHNKVHLYGQTIPIPYHAKYPLPTNQKFQYFKK